MQKQQTTVLHGAAKDVPTIVAQACSKVSRFLELIQEMEKSITVEGKSWSTYDNYSRHLAHLVLHYNQFPLDLSAVQVTDYLYLLKTTKGVSKSFFRFTVFGMRYACKMRGLPYELYRLPKIKHEEKLPEVLNRSEMKRLLEAHRSLKRKLIVGLLYGCGLRISELRHMDVSHLDLERAMVHVHNGKGSKDRCLPLGIMLTRALKTYLAAFNPVKYLFENEDDTMVSLPYIEGTIKKAAAKAEIAKSVHAHTLRHCYATHLLEQGTIITTIQKLLGHKRLETTLRYLHVIPPADSKVVNPMDALYGQQ